MLGNPARNVRRLADIDGHPIQELDVFFTAAFFCRWCIFTDEIDVVPFIDKMLHPVGKASAITSNLGDLDVDLINTRITLEGNRFMVGKQTNMSRFKTTHDPAKAIEE